ncbi:MAG: hypothetical protein ACREMX_12190, partial [Gemmatimonadales bacterium]
PRLGGTPWRIRREVLSQWHPSGSRVTLWSHPAKSVVLADPASGDTSAIALPGSYDWLFDVEWSPSGTLLAYVTMGEPNRWALRVLGKDGTGARLVVRDSVAIASPRWSPEGDALYYLSGKAELRKVRLARSSGEPKGPPLSLADGLQVGPTGDLGTAASFTVTGDGNRLVYLKSLVYSNLWLLSSDGLGRSGSLSSRRITGGTALRRGATVSPDGRWIAYLEDSKEGTDLYRMPLAGGQAERLTFSGRIASAGPAWSPDGNELAFGAYDGGMVRVATIGAAGGEARVFAETGLPAMGEVAWAPGRLILHQVRGNRNYRLLDPSTQTQRPLVSEAEVGWIFSPRASPDGERVAVYWNRGAERGLWLISTRDSSRTLLKEGRVSPIGWSADGGSVLALAWESGRFFRLGVDGRPDSGTTLPFRDAECSSAEPARRGLLVCVVPEQVSDVWMVAGFDAGA